MTQTISPSRAKMTNEYAGNFYEAVRRGANIASIGDVMAARNETPIRKGAWNRYGWTREARIFVPRAKVLFIRNSPLLNEDLAKQLLEANSRGKMLYIQEIYEKQLAIAKQDEDKPYGERRAMVLPFRNTSLLDENSYFEVLEFCAGKYGPEIARTNLRRLREEAGINGITYSLMDPKEVDKEKKPFISQSWFCDIAGWVSAIRGVDLGYDIKIFRVSD